MKINAPWGEFTDRRLALFPALSFGKDGYYLTFVQCCQQATEFFRKRSFVVPLRRQLDHPFEPIDNLNQRLKPLQYRTAKVLRSQRSNRNQCAKSMEAERHHQQP